MRVLPALLLLAPACAGPDVSLEPIPIASIDVFAAEVQPHIAERCGSGACHGRGDRPLALFVPGAHRVDPDDTYLDESLTRWELEENARRLSAFALGTSAADSLAIRKPLAVGSGGLWHSGGETFTDLLDPACIAMSAWLDARPLGEVIREGTGAMDGGVP